MEDKEQAKIKKDKLKPHPKTRSNIFSHFFFCWEIPIIFKGWKKELTEDDLYAPLEEYESKRLTDKLEEFWNAEENFQKTPSLWRCLIKLFGFEYMLYGVLYAPVHIAITLLLPYCLRKFLDFFSNQEVIEQGYIYGGGLAVVCLFRVFFFHIFLFASTVVGMKVRIACSSLVYRRALLMKKTTIDKITVGQLVNLISNDVARFDQVAPYLHFLWIGLVELVIGVCYLDVTLGPTSLGGVSIVLLSLAIQAFSMVKISKSRQKVAEKTDYRIRLMNDIISGIEAIKMYTWEKPFAKLVTLARRNELSQIKVSSLYRLFVNTFKIYVGKTCVFVSILIAVLTNSSLTSQYAFSLIIMYECFKLSVMVFLPAAAIMFAETIISVQRIQNFLLTDHQKPLIKKMTLNKNVGVKVLKFNGDHKKHPEVSLENVYVKYDSSYKHYVLKSVNFFAKPGEFVGVVGTAGGGKSTLLQVILNELDVDKGTVEVHGSVSYASQEAWIFPTSIKQNILFGLEFNEARYRKVVRVCALERDFSLFPYGDQTLVGERGIMLSGGQKARINLARAVYKNAEIYLLDDPLSAVDSHVARHIHDECLLEFLAEKCVVLVTHQEHYLQEATRIYQIESGEVVRSGSYQDVIGEHSIFESISMEAASHVLTQHDLREEVKEHRTTGTTSSKAYKCYCLAAGHWSFTLATFLGFALGQAFVSLADSFLTVWMNIEQEDTHTRPLGGWLTTKNCLYVYVVLTVLAALSNHVAAFVFTLFSVSASRSLHRNMLAKVVFAPMTFFNHHPSGRLLNRFSKDMGCIDEILPTHLMNAVTVFTTAVAIFVVIVALNYWMIVPSFLLVTLISLFVYFFQPTNRNIKRTEGITRSLVFTHISTSVQGLATIRAHNTQTQLIQEFDDHQNTHSSAFYLFTATFAAFGFWADFLTAVYTFLVIFGFFFLATKSHPGNVGLAITQSINLLGMVQYGVKTIGELDSQMTSVERVAEYAALDPEVDGGAATPPEAWPLSADLAFEDVSLRYDVDDPPVLKKTRFVVKDGEKVGIIGRTGAGKTSLISVLFRLFSFEGSVVIDNVDTKTIPLRALRAKISIIPQEPILFLGSLRKNIDPFDEYSDSQLWSALEELELKTMISNLPQGLETLVSERGSNFSVGQRQLFCLVRAMLRHNKIIVLDEATANVDLKTDELIQSLIRKKFKKCTVLTIAHRLNTIIDSDKILAMDGGRVVEFDHPYHLLQKSDGFFYGFVKKNGDKMMSEFLRIARNALEEKEEEMSHHLTFHHSHVTSED